MLSCRGARKLSSYLVRTKVYEIGSCCYGKKRCQVCLNVTDSFITTSSSETYKINYLLNFSEKYLVHLLTCWVCLKQYVDQTVDEFWNRQL